MQTMMFLKEHSSQVTFYTLQSVFYIGNTMVTLRGCVKKR